MKKKNENEKGREEMKSILKVRDEMLWGKMVWGEVYEERGV